MSERQASESTRRKKASRAQRACDFCSRRNLKCAPSETSRTLCESCEDYGHAVCTFDRPVRKRGAKPKSDRSTTSSRNVANEARALRSQPTASSNAVSTEDAIAPSVSVPATSSWQPTSIASQAVIMDLAEVYLEVVSPVFPFFHAPTLLRRISRCEHHSDRALHASVMAMCALASARVRDGALYSTTWDVDALKELRSETFFDAARHALPSDAPLTCTHELGYQRACALLAVTSIQYGKPAQMNYWLGVYHTFVAVGAFHDESLWPAKLDAVEIEERRRLFWSMYTLDVFTSVIWGGIVRSREALCNVNYPTEVDDESFSKDGYTSIEENGEGSKVHWLSGWNFVTDLYRVLEHAQDDFRSQRTTGLPSYGHQRRTTLVTAAYGNAAYGNNSSASRRVVLDHVMTAYAALPDIFKSTKPVTGRLDKDLYSFQAANIAATIQLVRMMLFATERSTIEEKCQIAHEVINGFASVPHAYLRAISVPLLHHLAGIGSILGSAFAEGMSYLEYQMVRSALLSLADLLSGLETDLCRSAGTAEKLRTQVSRMDEYSSSRRNVTNTGQGYFQQGGGGRDHGYNRRNANSTTGIPIEQYTETPTAPPERQYQSTTDSSQVFFPDELIKDLSWAFDMNFVP